MIRKRFATLSLLAVAAAISMCLSTPALAAIPQDASPWWKNAVIYEMYVRSFQDSNGDGTGDIRGLISRLDYLKSLGVAIWLTPMFPSPQKDLGYDVSNFCAVDPTFGSTADMDELLAKSKQRGMRVILDLVLNHTSDQHPWFQASRNINDPKRDWYIWRGGRASSDGSYPNNWRDRTDDSAWQFDATSNQYYYHYFAKEQPDLNWRNPDVRQEMLRAAEFWLKKGVAGFRLDAVNMLFEDPQFRDEPSTPGRNEYGEPAQSQQYQSNLPEIHGVMKDLRKTLDRFPGSPVLVGEVYTQNVQQVLAWYGANNDEVQLTMNTSLGFLNRRNAGTFRKRLTDIESLPEPFTPLLVFDNHDQRRSIDRYGDGQHDVEIAKIIATILLGSRGSALMYQGQEIGMRTSPPKRKEDVRDPRGMASWPKEKGRDGERTPMQWNHSTNAGFTTGTPWLTTPASDLTATVQTEAKDPASLFNWYRKLLALRRQTKAAKNGSQYLLNADEQNILIWGRSAGNQELMYLCNLSDQPQSLHIENEITTRLGHPGHLKLQYDSLHAAVSRTSQDLNRLELEPFQVLIGIIR